MILGIPYRKAERDTKSQHIPQFSGLMHLVGLDYCHPGLVLRNLICTIIIKSSSGLERLVDICSRVLIKEHSLANKITCALQSARRLKYELTRHGVHREEHRSSLGRQRFGNAHEPQTPTLETLQGLQAIEASALTLGCSRRAFTGL